MNLKEIRKKRQLTLEQLAQKIGSTKSNLSLIENGKINITMKKAEQLSEILNCKVTDLIGTTIFNSDFNSKMIAIKYYNINASAGSGCFNENENEFEIINIDERQLIKMGIKGNYKNIIIINAKGDSMNPTIKDGDLLFVDTTKKEIFNKKIYIINEKGFAKVKRILIKSPFDKKITILSDNEVDGEYPPYDIYLDDDNNNIICGQVIFYCRNIL